MAKAKNTKQADYTTTMGAIIDRALGFEFDRWAVLMALTGYVMANQCTLKQVTNLLESDCGDFYHDIKGLIEAARTKDEFFCPRML